MFMSLADGICFFYISCAFYYAAWSLRDFIHGVYILFFCQRNAVCCTEGSQKCSSLHRDSRWWNQASSMCKLMSILLLVQFNVVLLFLSTWINLLHTQPFNGLWSGTTRVGRPSGSSDIPYHLPPFTMIMASSFFILSAWQSSRTTSLQVLFGLPLGLGPSTSYSIHFFTQSSSSFCSTCPYQCSLFCCNTNAMSSISSLSQLLTWESVY